MSRISVILAVSAVAAGVFAGTGRADGDPASDYLLVQKVFFPIVVKFPPAEQAKLSSLVEAANRAGFKIRVALIASPYDMGSVTSLYGKPRAYARFLGSEIAFVYKQRLLVVMRGGFGFYWPHHPAAPAYGVLRTIPVRGGKTALLGAAQTAVQRLVSAAGIRVSAPADVGTSGGSSSHSGLVILAAALAALLLAAATVVVLRRRGG
jgi:hypothetical protein